MMLTSSVPAHTLYGLLLIATCYGFHPASYANDDWIEYRDGRLSVNFIALDLDYALTRTTEETGVSFTVKSHSDADPVNVEFAGKSLADGIRRILSGYNFMMLYETAADGHKRIGTVVVLGKAQNRAPVLPEVMSANATPELESVESFDSHVVLTRDRNGHYVASGLINERPAAFIVDTGATLVAIPGALASQMGLPYGNAKRIETASGSTTGYATVLNWVQLGELRLQDVPAVIMPDMQLGDYALLGMSFLGAFDLIQRNNVLTIQRRRENEIPEE